MKQSTLMLPKELQYLRKLAIDERGNIYCGFDLSDYILQCDSNGENIVVRKINTGEHGINGFAVVGDEVMILLQHRNGVVIVYDKELNYKRCIESE